MLTPAPAQCSSDAPGGGKAPTPFLNVRRGRIGSPGAVFRRCRGSVQFGGDARAAQQADIGMPLGVGAGVAAALSFDVLPDQFLAVGVVDDVAAVVVEEGDALLRPLGRGQGVDLQPVGGGVRVHAAVEVAPRGLDGGGVERLGGTGYAVVGFDLACVEPGQV